MACWHSLLRALIFGLLYVCARATGPYQTLGDIFDNQLATLEQLKPTGNPYLGGQSFSYCCYLAINESLEIIDGNLQFKPGQVHLSGDVSTFLQYQFPCGASYNGSEGQPSQVWVTWKWCNNNCPGWEIAKASRYSFWIQPLVAFIIPSVVFCLNIPRRRKIQVPDALFPRDGSTLSQPIVLPFKVCAGFVIVALDTVIWLATVLILAGPMLISGIFEAVLDLHVINLLSKEPDLSVRDRAQLLYVVLIGNLDQSPAWDHLKTITAPLPGIDTPRSSKIRHITRQISHGTVETLVRVPTYVPSVSFHIDTTKTRLKSMLESQYSFGATVGAAIIFFVGGFIYALIEIQSTYGAASTAHRLAFGMFWMIIPHIAVVSSVLLAGNNPSSWAGVAAHFSRADLEKLNTSPTTSTAPTVSSQSKRYMDPRSWSTSLYRVLFHPSFPGQYYPAWLWNRGTNKAMWLSKLVEDNPHLSSVQKGVLHLGLKKWLLYCIMPTYALLIIPSLLGIMISYVTPVPGISCRSGAILVYVSAQLLLILLWLVDVCFWKRDSRGEIYVLGGLPSVGWLQSSPWYMLGLFGVLAAFLFSLISTIFTFINLYVNCLCFFPIWYWWDRRTSDAQVYLGNNSFEKVVSARRYWTPCGLSATAFLVAVAYVGWWYQRRLRAQFRDLVDNLGSESLSQSRTGRNSRGSSLSPTGISSIIPSRARSL